MPKITKRTRAEDGPRATAAKLKDAQAMLNAIQTVMEKARRDRANDQTGNWAHFDDACRLLEELKKVGDLLRIPRNEVAPEDACPECGTRDVDRLLIDEGEVRCTVCGCEYTLD
jgi:hypothetical protein